MVCSVLSSSSSYTTILLCCTEHSFLKSYHYPCQVLRMAYHHCYILTHKPSSHHQLFHYMLQDLVCTCWQHCEQQWSCRWHICVFLCCRSCQFSTRQHKPECQAVDLLQSKPMFVLWISKSFFVIGPVAIEVQLSMSSSLEHDPLSIFHLTKYFECFGIGTGWCNSVDSILCTSSLINLLTVPRYGIPRWCT